MTRPGGRDGSYQVITPRGVVGEPMGKTTIAWADYTFNPWWGCQRVSPGCSACYAEAFVKRVGHGKRLPMIWGPPATAERRFFGDKHWALPLKWNAKAAKAGVRRRVFCASMADVFEDQPNPRPDYFYEDRLRLARRRLWRLIHETPHLDWLLLTKRPENAERLAMQAWSDQFALATNDDVPSTWWLPNIWLGTTVEDQKRADERIPELRKVPARVRFLSCEPLLEGVDISEWISPGYVGSRGGQYAFDSSLSWVICGGESGPGARLFDVGWARSLRDQCKAAGVPYFFKQLGSFTMERDEAGRVGFFQKTARIAREHGGSYYIPTSGLVRNRNGEDPSEWPSDLRIREWPEAA